jgi:VWFA-related protein
MALEPRVLQSGEPPEVAIDGFLTKHRTRGDAVVYNLSIYPPQSAWPETNVKLARLAVGMIVLAMAGALFAAPARAQQPEPPQLIINQIVADKFPEMNVVLTVLDARGVPAEGLTAADFEAFEGQTKLQIESVQPAQNQGLKLLTVITIDVSGSMAGAPFESAKAAAKQFVNSMSSGDEAALVSFSDKVTPVVALTDDKNELVRGIDGLQAVGGTALYEAVQTSSYLAAFPGGSRSAVILLSDGKNETGASTATAEGSFATATGAGVPIFTIGFGAAPDVPYLESLATGTKGAYRAATASNVSTVYADIATLLRSQYAVNLKGTGKADGKDGNLQISATVDNEPAVAVGTYKRGVAPATAPSQPLAPPVTNPIAEPPAEKSNTPAVVFAAIVAAIGAAIIGYLLFLWFRKRRVRRAQMKVIAPNIQQAAAQPLDPNYRAPLASASMNGGGGVAVAEKVGTGVLRDKNGSGQVYALGAGPAIIGTSARACNIVLPASDQVAAEHLRIWLRDGHYVLHHVGGIGRKTLIGGQVADWVTLEPGDELTIGPHKLVFEDPGA